MHQQGAPDLYGDIYSPPAGLGPGALDGLSFPVPPDSLPPGSVRDIRSRSRSASSRWAQAPMSRRGRTTGPCRPRSCGLRRATSSGSISRTTPATRTTSTFTGRIGRSRRLGTGATRWRDDIRDHRWTGRAASLSLSHRPTGRAHRPRSLRHADRRSARRALTGYRGRPGPLRVL